MVPEILSPLSPAEIFQPDFDKLRIAKFSPKEAFRGAILSGATAIIVAHNHPSGDPSPSSADIQVTRALREAAKIIEIDLLDHVVVADPKSDPRARGFYSFREAGLI